MGTDDNMNGWRLGDLRINPALTIALGGDTAPDGAAPASALGQIAPAVSLADPLLGFTAFAGANATVYPQNPASNNAGTEAGFGEALVLPDKTFTVSAARVSQGETAFALNPAAPSALLTVTAYQLRASASITSGILTFAPEFAITKDSFAGPGTAATAYNGLASPVSFAGQASTNARAMLTITLATGGPESLVVRAGASQSRFANGANNAVTDDVLAGVQYAVPDLWRLQLLAGVAQRRPETGARLTGPVLEAGLDWQPDAMDQVRFNAARAIDDPDQISPLPYTLNRLALSLRHDDLNSRVLHVAAQIANAHYIASPLHETLFTLKAGLDWQVSPNLQIDTVYQFNSRTANYLQANNEHQLTIGFTWTP